MISLRHAQVERGKKSFRRKERIKSTCHIYQAVRPVGDPGV
ncbi:hypothetical protein BDA96_02G262100 [Sorghum bicolor]|uniref:Uncharacterized protein n=1 Tax=Sorghum bicolor TaxID=4558 RepID=A0A921UUW9_SORBI|nr:hypothetical protein BDA96_02G262100 [Sorghum bicolor]